MGLFKLFKKDKKKNEQEAPAVPETPAVKKEEPSAEEGDPAILEKIAERAAAKKAKDYAKADAIRAELLAQGIVLVDTPTGTTYKKQ